MPVPIEPHELTSYEISKKLQEKGFTAGYYAALQAELDARNERTKAIEKYTSERKKARARKPKPRGKLDSRSVEHTVKNTVGAGGLGGIVFGGRELLVVYDELKGRGIAPTESNVIDTLQAQGWSDETKVYFWSFVILVALATLGWKMWKKYP